MNSKAEKLVVVESDDALGEQIVAELRDAGYEVSTDHRESMTRQQVAREVSGKLAGEAR